MLVNLERFNNVFVNEESDIDIRGAAKKLRKLKQYMGPVTVVWSDYVLEAAKESDLNKEQRIKLVEYMERDIRRAVKKDKGEVIYGVIAAFFCGVAPDPENFIEDAIEFVSMAGIDPVVFKEQLSRIRSRTKRILTAIVTVAKALEPELASLLEALLNSQVNRTNYFERFGRRKLETVIERLNQTEQLFYSNEKVKQILERRNLNEQESIG